MSDLLKGNGAVRHTTVQSIVDWVVGRRLGRPLGLAPKNNPMQQLGFENVGASRWFEHDVKADLDFQRRRENRGPSLDPLFQ